MGGCPSARAEWLEGGIDAMFHYSFINVILVICFVCDGAKPNRKFLKGLGIEDEMKTRNRYPVISLENWDKGVF